MLRNGLRSGESGRTVEICGCCERPKNAWFQKAKKRSNQNLQWKCVKKEEKMEKQLTEIIDERDEAHSSNKSVVTSFVMFATGQRITSTFHRLNFRYRERIFADSIQNRVQN